MKRSPGIFDKLVTFTSTIYGRFKRTKREHTCYCSTSGNGDEFPNRTSRVGVEVVLDTGRLVRLLGADNSNWNAEDGTEVGGSGIVGHNLSVGRLPLGHLGGIDLDEEVPLAGGGDKRLRGGNPAMRRLQVEVLLKLNMMGEIWAYSFE